MTDTAKLVPDGKADISPTPNEDSLERRYADFATFGDALDYAASGRRGLNSTIRAAPWSAPIHLPSCAGTRWPVPAG